MRHGDAVDHIEPDHARVLSEFGKKQCEDVGMWLHKNLSELTSSVGEPLSTINLALVSPYIRAQQSFRAVSKHIKVGRQVTIDAVTPMGNAAQSADLIHGYATDLNAPKCMLVVTHMPLVSLLSDRICLGFNAKYFDTADALVVDYSDKTGTGEQLDLYTGLQEEM